MVMVIVMAVMEVRWIGENAGDAVREEMEMRI
jgi:hypothetical protein